MEFQMSSFIDSITNIFTTVRIKNLRVGEIARWQIQNGLKSQRILIIQCFIDAFKAANKTITEQKTKLFLACFWNNFLNSDQIDVLHFDRV